MHYGIGRLAAIFICLTAISCASAPTTSIRKPEPLGVSIGQDREAYRISVRYINENDFGVAQDVQEIRATVIHALGDGRNYFRWMDYETRQYAADAAPGDWKPVEYVAGFEYFLDEEVDYLDKLPNVDYLPRNMEGFHFYLNLIDFHMWGLYKNMFFNTEDPKRNLAPLRAPGDAISYDLRSLPIALVEWENVSTDLRMTAGTIDATYLGTRETESGKQKIVSFLQQQTLNQTIYGMGMSMPFEGTGRFLGHMYVDESNGLVSAEFREFVYGKVYAPMDMTVITHTTRVYRIDRVEGGT